LCQLSLAAKLTEVEIPQSVKPDTVFEAVVKIPYDLNSQQVLGDGSKGGLNVGAVVMLPEGFKIAPEDRIPEELKKKLRDFTSNPTRKTRKMSSLSGRYRVSSTKKSFSLSCLLTPKLIKGFTSVSTLFM
jgi:hypothetical protein